MSTAASPLRASVVVGILGIGLCVSGYFLPAVRFPSSPMAGQYLGYECAMHVLSLSVFFIGDPVDASGILCSAGIHPLLAIYLFFCMDKRPPKFLIFVAAGVVGCCLGMWHFLAGEYATLLVGHYLWIAGIAVILSAPLANWIQG